MKHTLALLTGLFLLAAGSGNANAVVLIGNLGAPPASLYGNVGTNPGGSPVLEMEVSFIMPNQTLSLENVKLALRDSALMAVAGAPLIQIWTDDGGGLPGAALATLTGPATVLNGSSLITYTFTPTATVNLLANQTYHVVLGESAGGLYLWNDSDPVTDPTGLAILGNYRRSIDGGAFGSPLNNRFRIEVNAVPEPSRALLALLGVGVVLVRRRR
jgi:hypothetical protein